MPIDQTTVLPQIEQTDVSTVRPLLVSDASTVQKFYSTLRHMLFGFEAQGISSSVVVTPGSEAESLLWPGIEMIEYPALRCPIFYRQNRRRLFAQVEKFSPTIVHCLGKSRASVAKAIGRAFDIPVVLSVNSSPQNFFSRGALKKGLSAIIAPSGGLMSAFKKQNPTLAPFLRQVNTGTFVDETCVCFARPDRIPSVVMVSDLNSFSALEPLLNSVRHLAVDGYEFLVVLMGKGCAERKIRSFIRGVGLSATVSISPEIQPLRTVFRGADIFIQPYATKKFDPALIEAAGAGAAVATDRANADDFLRNNSTALFFDSKDELSVYSALQRLLDEREFARSLSLAAQDYLRSHNTVSEMIEQLLKIYAQAAI